MTEQERADALAEQLDALLTGTPPTSPPPDELAELLQVAGQLTAAAPAPRPEFGPALKESLLKTGLQGGPATATAGGSLSHGLLAVIIGGVIITLVALGLLAGSMWFNRATPTPNQSPAPAATADDSRPAGDSRPTPPAAEATIAPQATLTNQAADTLAAPSPAPSPTLILDVMPPLTDTVEATGQPISLPELIPGQPSSGSGDDADDDGGNGGGGDHNRGHGNDPDHHDEDNPGRSQND